MVLKSIDSVPYEGNTLLDQSFNDFIDIPLNSRPEDCAERDLSARTFMSGGERTSVTYL